MNTKFSYGKIKSDFDTNVAEWKYDSPSNGVFEPSNGVYPRFSMGEGSSKVDYFGIDIIPELSFFISSRFSLYLGLGGISYSLLDWETEQSNWSINFNPTYWKTGLKIKF